MQKNILRKFLENISYTIFANMMYLGVSFITLLILPKIIGIVEYSYWQLYVFYSSYIVFLSIGWCDGVYLRYGGFKYKDLPKSVFVTQFWSMIIYLLIITSLMAKIILTLDTSKDRTFVLLATCVYGILSISKTYFQFVLQATNRIKKSAQIMMIDRVLFLILLIFIIIYRLIGFKQLIVIDLVVKLLTLIYSIIICRDITFGKFDTFKNAFVEAYSNISVGIKLTIANLAGILIIGIVRIGIEQNWSIETFGKISFTLSVNNIILLGINAIGIVIFPLLRRVSVESLPIIYKNIRVVLMTPLLGVIIFYYPIRLILSMWLPAYTEALEYMGLLFPIVIYESKMSLIINPYMKALRKEKILLVVNIIMVLMSVLLSVISTIIFNNLTLAIISITFIIAIRATIAEKLLANMLNLKINKDIFAEVLMTVIFISLNWYINSWVSVAIYSIVYIAYLFFNTNKIRDTIAQIKTTINSQQNYD